MARSVWKLGTVAMVAIALAFALAPTPATRSVAWNLVAFGAVASGHIGLRLHRPERRSGWRWLLGGLWILALEGLLTSPFWRLADDSPLLVLSTAGLLIGYLCIGAGAAAAVRIIVPDGDRDATLDSGVVMVAIATMLWGGALDPTAAAAQLPLLDRVNLLVFSVVPAGVTASALRILFVAGPRVPAASLLNVAAIAALVANVGRILRFGDGGVTPTWLGLLWILAFAGVAVAALHPSMAALARPAQRAEDSLPFARVCVLGLSLLAPPFTLHAAGPAQLPFAIGASIVISGLVTWRFAGMVSEHVAQRRATAARAERQAALAALAELALTAPPREEFIEVVESAITRHLGHFTGTFIPDGERSLPMGFQLTPVVGRTGRHGMLLAEGNRTAEGEDAAFLSTVAAILAGFLDRVRTEADMRHRALHDQLTGLPNRELLLDRVGHALARMRRGAAPPGLLFLDLDGFKQVNDSLGHAAGDALLVAVAERFGQAVRETDTLARFAGDEFVVLLTDAEPATVREVATRMLDTVAEPFSIDGHEVEIGVSVGLVIADPATAHPDELLLQADWAMYRAKGAGRGRVQEFSWDVRAQYGRRKQLEIDIEQAAARGELELAYLPVRAIVGDETGPIVGAEALVRWRHPHHDLVHPLELLAVAEATGHTHAIADWVLSRATEDLARWRRELPLDARFAIHVNLSGGQLVEPQLPARVQRRLLAAGAPSAHLVIDIPHDALREEDEDGLRRQLQALRKMGVRIAVDDYGSGPAALRVLRTWPLDVLKLDASLTRTVAEARPERTVVAALVRIARAAGIEVLAEGIEDGHDLRGAAGIGCGLGQGHHLGAPVSRDGLDRLLGLARTLPRPQPQRTSEPAA